MVAFTDVKSLFCMWNFADCHDTKLEYNNVPPVTKLRPMLDFFYMNVVMLGA